MKKSIAFLLALAFLILPISANAVELAENDAPIPSEDFIKVCDLLFSGNGQAFNQNDENVTHIFCNTYIDAYTNRDYATILDSFFKENVYYIQTHKESVQPREESVYQVAPRLVMTKSYEDSKVHLVRQSGFPYDGKSWYFIVTATGSFTYNDSTFQISSFPNPTISVSFSDLGAAFTGNLESMTTTTPQLNSSRSSASFTVTTKHTVSCPIPGVDYVTGTLGPFTNVSNFTISI